MPFEAVRELLREAGCIAAEATARAEFNAEPNGAIAGSVQVVLPSEQRPCLAWVRSRVGACAQWRVLVSKDVRASACIRVPLLVDVLARAVCVRVRVRHV
jgi:hypothetical protein